jgi:hypothetical protein
MDWIKTSLWYVRKSSEVVVPLVFSFLHRDLLHILHRGKEPTTFYTQLSTLHLLAVKLYCRGAGRSNSFGTTSSKLPPRLSGNVNVLSSTWLSKRPPNRTGPFCARNSEILRSTSGRKCLIRPWMGHAAASPRAQIVRPSTCFLQKSKS